MLDRIKQMAEEAGIFEEIRDRDEKVMGGVFYASTDDLVRFAQAVARECAEIVDAQYATEHNKACPSAVNGYWPDQVTHAGANAIRARFGLASPDVDG